MRVGAANETGEPKSQELNYSARISLDRTQMVPFAFVLGKLH